MENNNDFVEVNSTEKNQIIILQHLKGEKTSGFAKAVFVPFVSGIVGASLVVGLCAGVPSVKKPLLALHHKVHLCKIHHLQLIIMM